MVKINIKKCSYDLLIVGKNLVKLLMELQTGPSRSESLSCVIELWYFMAELRICILNGENIAKPAPPVLSFALFLSHKKVLAQHKNLRECAFLLGQDPPYSQ